MLSDWLRKLHIMLSVLLAGKLVRGTLRIWRLRASEMKVSDAPAVWQCEPEPVQQPVFTRSFRVPLAAVVVFLIFSLSFPLRALSLELITNNATLSSTTNVPVTSSVTVTAVVRAPSTLEFMQYAPTAPSAELIPVSTTYYLDSGGSFVALPPPTPVGSADPIDLSNPVPLLPTTFYHKGEPVFLRLSDQDQNLDPLVTETLLVTVAVGSLGESELLRLTETGADTGVFSGYVQSHSNPPAATSNDGTLSVVDECQVDANYVDVADGSDTSADAAVVDPFGIVFDSGTGLPVDGASITLIETTTGLPAVVFGDDGVSIFPATITSGGTATDSGGKVYNLPPGGYRFPLVVPGDYRLDVIPPAGFAAPSTVSTAVLQSLPGAPFAIVDPGSRGEPFVLNPGPAFRIDIPIDPSASGLWIRKTASKNSVAVGDFLQYSLSVQNLIAGVLGNVVVTDKLPLGFRYQKGSAKVDGNAAADLNISSNGRTLTFSLGNLAANTTLDLRYVVEVAAGAKQGDATNQAVARADGGVTSNVASATVKVEEDLFRSRTIIMGRVIANNCGDIKTDDNDGVEGVRIFLEDGTYVMTDEKGMFHFEGVTPGVHVVQLDLESLPQQYEVVTCEQNTRFAGTPYSQFVDLQGGTMWRADFHVALKPRPKGEVSLELNSELKGHIATYRLLLQSGTVPLRNVRVSVVLPEAATYLTGTSRLGEMVMPEPEILGHQLTYHLGDVASDWTEQLHLQALIDTEMEGDEMVSKATLVFDTPTRKDERTQEAENVFRLSEDTRVQTREFVLRPRFATFSAELSEVDKKKLDRLAENLKTWEIVHISVRGHTDDVRISPRSRHIYADNYALSLARAGSVGRYLAAALDLNPEQVTPVGMGPDEPVATNQTPQGRARNRRVEVLVQTKKVERETQLEIMQDSSGVVKAEVTGLRPGESWEDSADASTLLSDKEKLSKEMEGSAEGIISPADGTRLANQVSAVRIRLDSRLKPRLLLDGKEISAERIGFRLQDNKTGKTLYSYIGVDFGEPGQHALQVRGIGPFGNIRFEDSVDLVRTGEIAAIRLLDAEGNIADGKTPIKLRLELLDSSGQPINAPAELEIQDGNLRPLQKDEDLWDVYSEAQRVRVDAAGFAYFQPSNKSGRYQATLAYNDISLEVETYVKPELREWIIVGFAEGTVGYNTLSGNMENLNDADVDDKYYSDSRVAFYAKGKVRGKWLITVAYDSDKKKEVGKSLFQTINPDTFYTLYGDGSQQEYDAASARKLYVKIERDQFYALFGDYNTGLTVTELSRYDRSFNGLKSELQTQNFSLNVFGSKAEQAFVKDEIRGDGTSGLYRLAKKNIVRNSEKIVIQTRDRFRSELIFNSRSLSRYIDYNIDYADGTLFFKEPIYSKDENLNPIFIVVDYETNYSADDKYNFGGRGAVKLMDQKLEIGATYIHEEEQGGDADLGGLDATVTIGKSTKLKGEFATTWKDNFGDEEKGDAYLVELSHQTGRFDGTAYIREQDEDFGLGQQNGSESGTRKFGIDAAYHFTQNLGVSGMAYRHYNLVTDAKRDVGELRLNFGRDKYSMYTGFLYARDKIGDGTKNISNQIIAGGRRSLYDNRLQLRLDHEQSLGKNANPAYPTRTILGADYKIAEPVSLFAEQEFTFGKNENTQGSRLGMKVTPWTGGEVASSVERQYSENGYRVFANLGLKQTWHINEKWSVDGGLDHSRTVRDNGSAPFNVNVPPASGSADDFTAVTLGTAYREETWFWNSRVEYRHADNEDKWGFTSGIYGEPRGGLGLSAGLQVLRTDTEYGLDTTDSDVRLGLAYRPKNSPWIVLDRLDFILEDQDGNDFDTQSRRIVNNLNANLKLNDKIQLSAQYGAKYVRDNFDADHYSGYTDLIGLEARYDVAKRWDIGIRGSVLHSWNSEQLDYSTGVSIGHNLFKNVWLSLGYNFVGFEDNDFSGGSYRAKGVFFQFRIKVDQQTVEGLLNALTGMRRNN